MTLRTGCGDDYPCLYIGEEYAIVVDEGAVENGYDTDYAFTWKNALGRWVISGYCVDPVKGMTTDNTSKNSDEHFNQIFDKFIKDWPEIQPVFQNNIIKEFL